MKNKMMVLGIIFSLLVIIVLTVIITRLLTPAVSISSFSGDKYRIVELLAGSPVVATVNVPPGWTHFSEGNTNGSVAVIEKGVDRLTFVKLPIDKIPIYDMAKVIAEGMNIPASAIIHRPDGIIHFAAKNPGRGAALMSGKEFGDGVFIFTLQGDAPELSEILGSLKLKKR